MIKPKKKRFLLSVDRLSSIKDWYEVFKKITEDQNLSEIITYSRLKRFKKVKERFNSEKKLEQLRNRPGDFLYTNYVLRNLVASLSTRLRESGKVITCLTLDGIPLANKKYLSPLIDGLKDARNLTVLSLSRCRIGDSGCDLLLNSITGIASLRVLNLTSCCLTNRSSLSLSGFLKKRKSQPLIEAWNDSSAKNFNSNPQGLRTLALNHNRKFSDCGVRELVKILREDFSMEILNIRHCGVTESGGKALLDFLQTNYVIRAIDLKENDIPESILYKISKILSRRSKNGKRNPSKRGLIIGKNDFRTEMNKNNRKKSRKKIKIKTSRKKSVMMNKRRVEFDAVKLSDRLSKVIFGNEELVRGLLNRRIVLSEIKTQRLEIEKSISQLEPRVRELRNEICNREEMLSRISQESNLFRYIKSSLRQLANPEIEGSEIAIALKNKNTRHRKRCW